MIFPKIYDILSESVENGRMRLCWVKAVGSASLKVVFYHLMSCDGLLFLRSSRRKRLHLVPECVHFFEFWVNAFSNRHCKSRAKFKLSLIRIDDEARLTRKVADFVTHKNAKALVFSQYLSNASFFLNFGWMHFNFGLAKAVQNSKTTLYAEVSKRS